ncbi:MAG: D-alanine--D-alanine ligase [Actinobacteria bacterium HGW-Actinobacteria-7]|jgi:D-alanine-D-alanine ligase|nr:MAG: D-alanine--D-alanine ligase [Actinobacteria bacterium HGW-Actinobacteria-7]
MTIHPEEIRVAVLMGGRSAEREVSLHTGAQVSAALRHSGFDVVEIDSGDDEFVIQLARAQANVVFICLHGRFGEDGTVQGLCELLELPYVGSGVLASALAMDKVMSKQLFVAAGIPTPEHVIVKRGDEVEFDRIVDKLGPKTVVKPANEGSAIGVTIVHEYAELPAAIGLAFNYDRSVLVERFVAGTEITVGVLGNEHPIALPTLEIVPEHEFYDYDSKYTPGMSRHIIPARVSEAARRECERLSVIAHDVLGCRGMSRTDLIVTSDEDIYVLETNTIPGMTSTSLLPDAARAAGIEFPDLCARLVGLAMEPRR